MWLFPRYLKFLFEFFDRSLVNYIKQRRENKKNHVKRTTSFTLQHKVDYMRKVVILIIGILVLGTAPGQVVAPNSVEIIVHPNIELLSVVLSMTTWMNVRGPPHVSYRYGEDINEYFAPFEEHDAVNLAQELTDRGFTYDAPPGFILHFSQPPALEKLYPYSDYLKDRAGGEKILDDFAEALRRFAVESDFMTFYEDHRRFYSQIVGSVSEYFDQEKLISDLEGFFGFEQASYTIILAPYMFPSGGYGSRIEEKGKFHCFEIMRVSNIWQDTPSFGSTSGIYYLSLHEFGHSFVNPITEDFRSEVANYEDLFNPVADKMKSIAYGNWEIMLNETLIRAFTCYRKNEEYGTTEGNNCLSEEKDVGFYFVEDIFELYSEYMQNRDMYPDFKSFYPNILDRLGEIMYEDSTTHVSESPTAHVPEPSDIDPLIFVGVLIVAAAVVVTYWAKKRKKAK